MSGHSYNPAKILAEAISGDEVEVNAMAERKIGYIGLGNMGGGMAAHLVASGYDVVVYDLRAEAAQALVDKGATAAGSPREVATRCEIIISSLPTPRSVEDAVMGENGVAAGLDAEILRDVMNNTAASTLHGRTALKAKVFARNFEPGFKLALSHKDLGLAAQLAASLGASNMIGSAAYQVQTLAMGKGLGDEDQHAAIKVAEETLGVEVRGAD